MGFACPLFPFSLSTLVHPNKQTLLQSPSISHTNPHIAARPKCLTTAQTRPRPLYLSPLTASSSRHSVLLPCFQRQGPASVGKQRRLWSSSLTCRETSYHLPAALSGHTQQPTRKLVSSARGKNSLPPPHQNKPLRKSLQMGHEEPPGHKQPLQR